MKEHEILEYIKELSVREPEYVDYGKEREVKVFIQYINEYDYECIKVYFQRVNDISNFFKIEDKEKIIRICLEKEKDSYRCNASCRPEEFEFDKTIFFLQELISKAFQKKLGLIDLN